MGHEHEVGHLLVSAARCTAERNRRRPEFDLVRRAPMTVADVSREASTTTTPAFQHRLARNLLARGVHRNEIPELYAVAEAVARPVGELDHIDGLICDDWFEHQVQPHGSVRVVDDAAGNRALLVEHYWLPDVLAANGKSLASFARLSDPFAWASCDASKAFFREMEAVDSPSPTHAGWRRTVDETVDLGLGVAQYRGVDYPFVRTRLSIDYATDSEAWCVYRRSPAQHPLPRQDLHLDVDWGNLHARAVSVDVALAPGARRTRLDLVTTSTLKVVRFAGQRHVPEEDTAMAWALAASIFETECI